MVVITFVRLLKLAFASESDHAVLDREVEIFLIHSGKFGLKDNLILVLVDIDARCPSTPADPFIAKRATKVGREQTIYLFLKGSQISEGVIPYDSHKQFSSLYSLL